MDNKLKWVIVNDDEIQLIREDGTVFLLYRKGYDLFCDNVWMCISTSSSVNCFKSYNKTLTPQEVIIQANKDLYKLCVDKIHEYTQLKYQLPLNNELFNEEK